MPAIWFKRHSANCSGSWQAHPVKLELPNEPMLVRFDFSLAQHALANSACQCGHVHTPPGTPIEVQVRLAEDETCAERGGSRPGNPPELLPRIFDKFFRAPNAPTGGSGLGLTIAKGFIEAQGGAISAANRPGGGAVFSLRLPQAERIPPVEACRMMRPNKPRQWLSSLMMSRKYAVCCA